VTAYYYLVIVITDFRLVHPNVLSNMLLVRSGNDRATEGNALLVTLVVGFGIVLIVLMGLGFYLILSHERRGQSACDEASLTLAKLLNFGDHMGQMNSVVEHARELVYLSRQNDYAASQLGVPAYCALAQQLLVESRESADLVEKERQNQIVYIVDSCRNAIDQIRCSSDNGVKRIVIFPWSFETHPEITKVNCGSIHGTLSSVESPAVLTDLHNFDIKNDYIEPTSNLFRGDINAKLPPPDDDLPFHIASLPAQVKKNEAPPRLVNSEMFVQTACIFHSDEPKGFEKPVELPSAVQILGTLGLKTGKDSKLPLSIVSSATACSALEAP